MNVDEAYHYTLPQLDADTLQYLAECSKNYALMNGVIKRVAGSLDTSELVSYVPHTLFPSPIPKRLYDAANAMQDDISVLMMRVANDKEFLTETLRSVIAVDDFTAKLFDIYLQVEKEGRYNDSISFCVVRPDYMLDTTGPKLALKQVEINTIAAGMAGVGMKVADLHRYNVGLHESLNITLAGNQAVKAIGEGAVKAWELYGVPGAWVLFLVSVKEYNIFDQCWLEHTMREINPAVRVMRRTLEDVGRRATLTSGRRLVMDGKEIAFVYFRAGYGPGQYPTQAEWDARLLVERSRAVACPSVNWQLAGTKKIQQQLSKPGVLERFLTDPQAVAAIRDTFVHQYDLSLTDEGNAAAELGIKNPEKYVLKPQREGGGNNLYDDELRAELERLSGNVERGSYILMDRIQGQAFRNYEIRGPHVTNAIDMVTEYGPFGVILSHGDKVLMNKTTGYYMKSHSVNLVEGGISIGSAAMDSVAFV